MISPYVDVSRWQMLALGVSAKLANKATGEVATDRNGQTKWAIDTYVVDPETQESELLKITVAASRAPEIVPGQAVEFEGLRARYWVAGDRSGLSFSAVAVRPAQQSQRPVKVAS